MSIKTKLNLTLLILGVISSVGLAVLNYMDAKNRVFQEAFKKAELINSFAFAARSYTVQTMRPLAIDIAGLGKFHPEIMGGFFVARSIAETFAESEPGYTFKQATLDPVNPTNQSDAVETDVIKAFNADRNIKIQKGMVKKDDASYFYLARPVIAQKSCLLCHGDPAKAPEGRKQRYPGPGGYGYEENSVVAAFVTYVPVEQALSQLKMIAFRTAVVGMLCILFILYVLSVLLGRIVTEPILRLSSLADEISRGKSLNKKLELSSNDEIGDLYQSFERMRKSVIKLIKMIRNK